MEQQETGVVGSGGQKNIQRLRWIITAVVAVLLLSAVTAYYVIQNRDKGSDEVVTRTNVCKEDINQQAAAFMSGNGGVVEYDQLVQKIKDIKGYDSDPNCLYIILKHNLGGNISTDNDRYLSRLEKVYDTSRGYSPSFGGNTDSLQSLREKVATLKSLNELHDKENEKMDDTDEKTLQYVDEVDVPQQ